MRWLKTFKPREIPAAINLGPPSSEVNHLVSTFFPQPYLNKKEISLSMCSFQTRKVLKRKISKIPNFEDEKFKSKTNDRFQNSSTTK